MMAQLPAHVYGRIQRALDDHRNDTRTPSDLTEVDIIVNVVVEYMDAQLVGAVSIEQAHTEDAEAVSEKLRVFIGQGVTAFHHTREYVGEEVLPAIPGWSWFDWTERAHTIIRREGEHDEL